MRALVCGSIAFDTIMVFPGRFREQIHPDRIHMLNVSFMVPEMRREFGGCAGNVCYSLGLLGVAGAPMATAGKDFAPYRDWMVARGLETRYVLELDEAFTAQAFITTDLDDNQITAFHPGAMNSSHLQAVPSDGGITIGMVSPDGKQGMIEHATQFASSGIPFVFDPGQGLPMFDGPELTALIEQADWVTVNDYESKMLEERTGLSPAAIAERVRAYVVTRGAEGSLIHSSEGTLQIPVAKPEAVVDPTGCGDAYRAGLLFGLMSDYDLATTGRAASLLGAIKVASAGTQNHVFEAEAFLDRFNDHFGYRP